MCVLSSALVQRREHSEVKLDEMIRRKEFVAMVMDRPICLWGECYPVSEEEERRLEAEKEEAEELSKLKKKELKKAVSKE